MSVTNLPTNPASAEHGPARVRLVTLLTIIVSLGAVIATPFFVWGWGFRRTDLALLLGMYVLSGLGITVGFHRLFVHRSFETYLWAKIILSVLGSMAAQGPLFQWVGTHRRHHRYSDTSDDPHSPHHHGEGVSGVLKGFWHSHIGWFLEKDPPDLDRYVKDLRANAALRVVDSLFPLWVVLRLAIPAVIGGVLTLSWGGVWTGLIWGGLVRIFLVHHVTWSINSACHLWGSQPIPVYRP